MREYDYFSLSDADDFSFYRIPKKLVLDPEYEDMSFEAKFLYGILLDRLELSRRNGWVDEKGHVFIIFTVRQVMDAARCGEKKAMRLLAELEDAHLIERMRRGQGRPDLIYLKNFTRIRSPTGPGKKENRRDDRGNYSMEEGSELSKKQFLNSQKGSSRTSIRAGPELPKRQASNTDINKTDKSETDINLISSGEAYEMKGSDEMDAAEERNLYRDYFSRQAGFAFLGDEYPYEKAMLEELQSLLVDVCCSKQEFITIAGEEKPAETVRSRLMKLTPDHIRYVMSSLKGTHVPVRNVRQYMVTTLYNATMTMNHYYQARYNSDKAGET